MGLFSFIGKIVSNTAKAVGVAVGTVAEKVGRALKNDTIEIWGAELSARCQFGSTRWNETSGVNNTVDSHKELEKVKKSVEVQARIVEEELIEECISEVKAAIEPLLPLVSSDELLLLNESYAQKINEKLSDLIMRNINPKLSMDDPCCKNVLNILDNRKRLEESKRYQDSVLSGAVDSFKKECIIVKNRYVYKILDLAEEGVREQEHECQRLGQLLKNRLEQTMDETEIDMVREQILIDIEKVLLLQSLNNQTHD